MQATLPSRQSRILVVAAVALVVIGGLGVATLPNPVDAQTSIDGLTVSDTEHTADGDVSDVTLGGQVEYDYDVPDATSRTLELRAGSSESNLEVVTFDHDSQADAATSGSVELSGSLTDLSAFSTDELNPEVAGATETEVVVEVRLEVERANGDTVTATETETVTLTINDGAELESTVGGDVSFGVDA